jgi:hypothetical protein
MANYPILYDINRIKFGKITKNTEILELFKIIFDRTFQEDILDWFASCPTGSNLWYGAFEDDQPVGMYGLLPIQINIENTIYCGALCNNVGIVPKLQGKGLFQSLGEYALNDSEFPIVVGVPNLKAVKGHKRIGWKSFGLLELLSSNLDFKNIESVDYKNFQYIPYLENKSFFVVKNFDFIKWRYSKPGTIYKQTFLKNNRYAIWKEYEGKKQILQTNDFETAFELGGQIDIWQFLGSNESQVLKTRGFKPILSNEFILYKNQEISLESIVNSIQFELGDNDVF